RDPRHDILFEPVRIGPKTLRTRCSGAPGRSGCGASSARSGPARTGCRDGGRGPWATGATLPNRVRSTYGHGVIRRLPLVLLLTLLAVPAARVGAAEPGASGLEL